MTKSRILPGGVLESQSLQLMFDGHICPVYSLFSADLQVCLRQIQNRHQIFHAQKKKKRLEFTEVMLYSVRIKTTL